MSDHVKTAKKILNTLKNHGFESYMVGGAVRNMLMNTTIKDIDITTNATPSQIVSMFEKTIDLNQTYGTVMVIEDDVPFEITTLRLEGDYNDHRHPDDVIFTDNIKLDSNRRDFTVNALYMDIDDHIYDFHQGQYDLKKGLLRTIGSASHRFKEDALRMLRACRFISEYNFDIDHDILLAIKAQKEDVLTLPFERIINELNKMFDGPCLEKALKCLKETELDKILFNASLKIKNIPNEFTQDAMWIYLINQDHVPSHWTLPKRVVKMASLLSPYIDKKDFTPFDCFYLGLEQSKQLQAVKGLIGYDTVDIKPMYDLLPIHSLKELELHPNIIKTMLRKEAYHKIESIQLECVKAVITQEIKNDHDDLIQFITKKIEEGDKQ